MTHQVRVERGLECRVEGSIGCCGKGVADIYCGLGDGCRAECRSEENDAAHRIRQVIKMHFWRLDRKSDTMCEGIIKIMIAFLYLSAKPPWKKNNLCTYK